MAEAVFNHLWQSTVCVLAAAILTLICRKDAARVRFLIWFAASAKFLTPLSLLVFFGGLLSSRTTAMLHVSPGFAAALEQLANPAAMLVSDLSATPLARASSQGHWNAFAIVWSVWVLGCVFLIGRRTLQWWHLLAVKRASTPLNIRAPIPVHETRSNLEPGVFGVLAPTVLVPAGIASQLATSQWDAILAHELCHWRRRDNLTAAIHILVETLFWFHPLVWWLGTRLVAERERACDEAVIQSGKDRHAYAEGILKVCRLYVGTPLWITGVSGGVLRKRIEEIMQNPVVIRLSLAKKGLLSVAVSLLIAAPVAAGLWGGSNVAHADDANSMAVKHYKNSEWKFALDLPGRWQANWQAVPPRSANNSESRVVMSFGPSDNADRLLLVTRHSFEASRETLKTILDSAEQDMAHSGFVHFVPGDPVTIAAKHAIRLDFERAPKDGEGVWYCRNYYILGSRGAYVLAFGARNITAAQRDAVFRAYEQMARSFVFEDL